MTAPCPYCLTTDDRHDADCPNVRNTIQFDEPEPELKCKGCDATEGIFRNGYCLNCLATQLEDARVRVEVLESYILRAYNAGDDHSTMSVLCEAAGYVKAARRVLAEEKEV